MAVAQPTIATTQARVAPPPRRRKWLGPLLVNGSLAIICILWTIPTFGLLVSSFRSPAQINTSGWWTVFPHQEYIKTVDQIQLPPTTALDQPISVAGVTVTNEDLRKGYTLPDGRQIKWARSPRERIVKVSEQDWIANADLSLSNYQNILTGAQYTIVMPDGTVNREQGEDLSGAFISTLVVAIPSTVIPILIAAFAAYAFAWMRFKGRRIMFGMVVALLVVPLQIALVPILTDYTNLNINGTYLAVWLAHSGFGLALATYLLYNYISQLPRDLFESAFIDGATPFTVFTRLVLPLSVPALASFAIFQFLWVWNDYLVALIFLGGSGREVMTMRLANLIGERGEQWYLLTSGAFISMLVPLLVFFGLQRFFVRGLLAGSVKG
ncbi:MAG TPA: carbohydrate ABC transporter permease [Chloroflexia bacterium]|nr:carbohydrate ABC transporter permease [Chloroflexia bacterium]